LTTPMGGIRTTRRRSTIWSRRWRGLVGAPDCVLVFPCVRVILVTGEWAQSQSLAFCWCLCFREQVAYHDKPACTVKESHTKKTHTPPPADLAPCRSRSKSAERPFDRRQAVCWLVVLLFSRCILGWTCLLGSSSSAAAVQPRREDSKRFTACRGAPRGSAGAWFRFGSINELWFQPLASFQPCKMSDFCPTWRGSNSASRTGGGRKSDEKVRSPSSVRRSDEARTSSWQPAAR
jgi:hypothetical protein